MKKRWLHIFLAVGILAVDQITKYLARTYLVGKPYKLIEGVFQLHYHENTGSAWGMFRNQTIPLLVLSVVLLAILFWIYLKIPQTKHYAPLAIIDVCIMSGAVGNAIDRLLFHYVTDFLYFELINFPIFNVADCFISVPMVLLFILMLTVYRKDEMSFISVKKKK